VERTIILEKLLKGLIIFLLGRYCLAVEVFNSLSAGCSFICEGFLLSLSLRYCLVVLVLCLST
jgi:hypothetical protein